MWTFLQIAESHVLKKQFDPGPFSFVLMERFWNTAMISWVTAISLS